MKKRSEATQTLRAGCSKADPQTHKQTQGRLQYTAQLSAQCNKVINYNDGITATTEMHNFAQ